MSTIRIHIFDPQSAGDSVLREPLAATQGVRIAVETGRWSELQNALTAQAADVVAISLDGLPDGDWTVIAQVVELAPRTLILGFSQSRDGGRILAAMRAGCHQFVPIPIDPQDLDAALAPARKQAAGNPKSGLCVGVIPAAGGAGATTILCKLAQEMADLTHRRCAVVDMNLMFGDVASIFDAQPTFSLACLCRISGEIDCTAVQSAMHEISPDVALLARPDLLREIAEIQPPAVEATFAALRQMFSYVMVDLPRDFAPPTLAALGAMDRLLIITQLAVPHLRNAQRITQQLKQLGAALDGVEFVLNRGNSNHEHISIKEAEKHLGRPFFAIIPNDYRRVRASHDLGSANVQDANRSPIHPAIRQLAQKLAGSDAALAVETAEQGGGILGSLLGRRPKVRKAAR